MANIFRAKHLVSRTGTFSHEVTAPNLVYNNGDQTINGLKDFTTRPTVSTIPVLLSGESAPSLNLLVKNEESFTLRKGQPVYIYGANGNNILIKAASNTGDSTSSKTLGLLYQDLAPNDQGYVVTEGSLEGFDTSLAGSVGDPIWLGPTGNLIFGLAQKPYAPNHLVYLGVVERKQANNGKVYIKVQNGFELEELHNVHINHTYPLNNNDIIRYNTASGLWLNQSLNTGIFQDQINSLSGAAVLRYGYQTIDGTKVFRDNVYINNLYVTGTETILNTTSNNIASPYLLLNLTGGLTDGGIFFVTGSGLTGINDTGVIFGFDNITKSWHFGQGTRLTDISTLDEVMGYHDLSGYSGFANQTFSTIINLANTGSTLTSNINLLSGTFNTTGWNLFTGVNNVATNLRSTGDTLIARDNSMSGSFNTTGWNLFTGVNNVATNLRSTGDTLIARDNSMSGSFNTTGWNLFTGINNVATNLRTTGDTLIALTTSMSGTFNTTGLNLSNRINSLSGAAVLIYNNQNIGGNKTFTGITTFSGQEVNLVDTALNLSGVGDMTFSGTNINFINSPVYISGTNLRVDGNILLSGNPVLTGIPDGNWASQSEINSLSGFINSTGSNIVFTTGDQNINGIKTFNNDIGLGTNVPLRTFHQEGGKFLVNSTDGSWGQFQLVNSSAGEVTAVLVSEGTINNDGTLSSTSNSYIWAFGLGSYGNNPDNFIIGNNTIGNAAFLVKANGNVGIGTNNPTEKLEVNGNILLSGNPVLTGVQNLNIVFTTGSQIINGQKVFLSGIDIYSGSRPRSVRIFNTTGINSGEFGFFGWDTGNNLFIGAQQTQSGLLRDVILTGRNININASGVLNILDPVNINGNTTITGHLSATSKSFLIDHPTQIGKKLQYGSLESPYHGIRLTDKNKLIADSVKVNLPDYISELVNDEKVNIQLTNINHDKVLFVKDININENNFIVGMNRSWFDKNEYEFYWSFTAERKDIPKLTVEF